MDLTRREKILGGLNLESLVGIEIGPLCRPIVTKQESNVIYVDHADATELRKKYASEPTVDVTQIVEVDAVWGQATLQEAIGGDTKVDYVVASHVIEHVPDLIGWLQEIGSVLRVNGEVKLAVPDKRYTFDYLRRESQFVDAVNAYLLRARIPSPFFLLDHFLNFRTIDHVEAWEGTLKLCYEPTYEIFRDAVHIAREAIEGRYCDAHCWVFTPASFAQLFALGCRLGLIEFSCEDFYDTERSEIEFFVNMRKCTDTSAMVESWRRMAGATQSTAYSTLESRRFEIDRLLSQISCAERREEELVKRLRDAQAQLLSIHRSRSWKLTRPVRVIVDALRRRRL